MYRSLDDNIFGEIIDMKTSHEIWSYLNEKYGAVSDDDDRSTTSSLDKVDNDATSVASDDATPCTLDGNDGSCSM